MTIALSTRVVGAIDDHPLPRRPRLIAGIRAFQRGQHEVQIGLDPRHALIVGGLPRKLVRLLCTLDGGATLPALAKRAGDRAMLFQDTLRALAARGLLEDATPPTTKQPKRATGTYAMWALRSGVPGREFARRCTQSTVAVSGNGPLGGAIATMLAVAGIGHVIADAEGTVTDAEIGLVHHPDDVGKRKRQAIAGAMRRLNPAVLTCAMPSNRGPDLLVLADCLMPPPELIRQLMFERQPHLPVRFRDGIGIVGPLVLPGRTSCLHCADLHRADLDSYWPRVANQLIGRKQRADPVSVHATAAFATAQVLRIVQRRGERPPLWQRAIELDLVTGATSSRMWLPHPRCDCGASR